MRRNARESVSSNEKGHGRGTVALKLTVSNRLRRAGPPADHVLTKSYRGTESDCCAGCWAGCAVCPNIPYSMLGSKLRVGMFAM